MPQGAPQGTPREMLQEMSWGMPSEFYNNFFYNKLNVECCAYSFVNKGLYAEYFPILGILLGQYFA